MSMMFSFCGLNGNATLSVVYNKLASLLSSIPSKWMKRTSEQVIIFLLAPPWKIL
jgi:hypothetical protein